jgi:hypothetical protein
MSVMSPLERGIRAAAALIALALAVYVAALFIVFGLGREGSLDQVCPPGGTEGSTTREEATAWPPGFTCTTSRAGEVQKVDGADANWAAPVILAMLGGAAISVAVGIGATIRGPSAA